MAHSRKKLDLTGERYGTLTVLSPAENIGTRTAWRCRCDCGREIIAKTVYLRNGHVKSCGHDGSLSGTDPVLKGLASLTYVDGTCVEMLRANTVRRNNSSGVPGVEWMASKGTWRATICFKGKRHYLGRFARREDAVKARKRAEEQLIEPFLAEFEESPSNCGGVPVR